MARPLRIQYEGALYHVTCRGIEKRDIFSDVRDREKFLQLLSQSVEIYGVALYAFVLMSNHFHFVVCTPKANLSEFMRHFNICYTGYFNRRHKRNGNLYQGRYKSLLVEEEEYLNTVVHYVHINPVRVRSMMGKDMEEKLKRLKEYKWSSLLGYLDKKKRYNFVFYDYMLQFYDRSRSKSLKAFLREMTDHLMGKEVFDIKKETIGQTFLSSKEFAEEIIKKVKNDDFREMPQKRLVMKEILPQKVITLVERKLQVPYNRIISGTGVNAWLLMEMLYRFSGLKQVEIGKLFKRDYSTVSQGRKRLRNLLSHDKKIRKVYQTIEKELIGQD